MLELSGLGLEESSVAVCCYIGAIGAGTPNLHVNGRVGLDAAYQVGVPNRIPANRCQQSIARTL